MRLPAAKRKTPWIVLAVSALLLCTTAFASSIDVSHVKTHAELSAENGQFSVGQQALNPANATRYYDCLGEVASDSPDAPNRLPWDSWHNLPKVVENGTEYARIGDRLYTGHAVDRMLPSGLGRPAGGAGPGRSIAPAFVEDVIQNGTQTHVIVDGVPRTIHTSGTVQVVTEQGGRIVVTVNPFSGG